MTNTSQTLDLDAVDAYLRVHLPGYEGPLEAVKFEVGQSNPTFLLTHAGAQIRAAAQAAPACC